MRVCRLGLLLVLLVGADFACPLLPGVVAFEVEQSVDASRRLSGSLDQAVATIRLATGPERVILAEPCSLTRKPAVDARPSDQAPRGRSSTFLPPESSPAS
jgi:hypothetical protein